MADFPDLASAEAAGYALEQGYALAGYVTNVEKWLQGEPGARGFQFRVVGVGPDQASADADALASLNLQRAARYGQGNNGVLNPAFVYVLDVT
jgi:hypothetical protein